MEKINAYLDTCWNRWFKAKIIIFISKIAGIYMFLYVLGMGGYYENGGELTIRQDIRIAAYIVILAILVTFSERVENYRDKYAMKYRLAFRAKREMEEDRRNDV